MKRAWTYILLLLPLLSFSQDDPVTWNAFCKKIADNDWQITLSATIEHAWYIYGENKSAEGLESVSINWDNEQIVKQGDLLPALAAQSIDDPIFSARLKVYTNAIGFTQKFILKQDYPPSFRITVNAFASDGKQFLPLTRQLSIQLKDNPGSGIVPKNKIRISSIDINNPIADCGDQRNSKGLFAILLLGFAGGLFALLTPCVFPMIPVTVSFFTGKASSKTKTTKNGLLYGSFIFIIYLLASIPFHLLKNINPQILNTISTNAWVNVFFFAVFIFFSLSFFGLFEISLPGGLATKADARSGLANTGGIFFMALTLVIVSFSCTGPILGSLLVGSLSSTGGAWQLTAGMAGFGIALALPFAIFAIFPQWLKRLPKSGGWLDTVKKSLAFLELALAFKFLSNADLVQHWGILKREVFIAIWVLISLSLALYLLGAFKKRIHVHPSLRNADKVKTEITWPKKAFGLCFLLFTVYLIPGLTQTSYANLKLLSGFAPPLSYSIYGKDNVTGKGLEPDFINDYDKAMAMAKQQNKPLLIDFTGWACVNCRKMEEHVWPQPEISSIIKKNFILVSLYVDDRKKLPGAKRFTYTTADDKEKDIITLGDKWSTFQAENFNYVAQPLYVILSPDEKLMNNPVGYTPSVSEYKTWLQCGFDAFKTSLKID